MKKIEKKVLPEYYKEIRSHRKMFELRKDDSDYEVGDILILREWDGEKYTGCRTSFEITYILRNCPEYGLMDGYCILQGERLKAFYKYVYELVGRTVWTHELADKKMADCIRELSKPDFIKLCEEEDTD